MRVKKEKYKQPQEWMKIGAKVLYHPIINEAPDSMIRQIESEPWKLGHGQYVVKITGVSGGVALEAISHAELTKFSN
jgi:hypothetical protein